MSKEQWGHGYNMGYHAGLNAHKKSLTEDTIMTDELFITIVCIYYRNIYKILRSSLCPEDLDDQRARELFIVLEECYRKDIIDFYGLCELIIDERLKSLVIAINTVGENIVDPERLVLNGISRIKCRKLERRRSSLIRRMRVAKDRGMAAENLIDELLSETMHIDEELAKLRR